MESFLRARPGSGPARTRVAAAVAALVTVGAGLGLRAVAAGDVAKYGGDALYTLLILALVVLVAPRVTAAKAAGVALAVSWGVEFLQLTGLPAELSRHSAAARLVLGSTFNAPDLFWYAVGAIAGWLVARGRAVPAGEPWHAAPVSPGGEVIPGPPTCSHACGRTHGNR